MTAAEYLLAHPELRHGKIRIGFTPDEEIGRGVDFFDVKAFGADFAYTMDGGFEGELEYENFNAASAKIEIQGRNVHPGYAKDKMINAIQVACELNALLPAWERPEHTEGYDGFYHCIALNGTVDQAQISYIVRDHDSARFEARKNYMQECVDLLVRKYGEGVLTLTLKDSYYNMRKMVEPHPQVIDKAIEAMKMAGVEPLVKPIRGGTDGARLSFMGLPCPNIFTGGMNFHGRYEYLVNFFTFLAEEVREYLAEMGFKRLDDIIGRTDLIDKRPPTPSASGKYALLDFSKLLHIPAQAATNAIRHTAEQVHLTGHVKDQDIILHAMPAIEHRQEISLDYAIANTDRSVGAMLSGEIAKRYGNSGLPEHTLNIKFKGSAGQSFGAFLAHGVNFRLEGEANDYLGKGLSGGRISVMPPVRSTFVAENNTIAGNTLMYGATSGEVYINGRVGERFCVRNSGAIAVVEGVGDHCCEYMTGGRVVVLGRTGRNFAAGMSGGVAYVWNKEGDFDYYCNMEMVELSLIEDSTTRKELHELIRKHYHFTGSHLASKMLDNWNKYVDEFIQIVPIEYKKVLQEEQMKKLQQKIAEMQRDY